MFKKFLTIILMIFYVGSIFANPTQVASTNAVVTLNLSDLAYFRCGFSEKAPSNPLSGGFVTVSDLKSVQNGKSINIPLSLNNDKIGTSKEYYIWILRVGFIPVTVTLTGTALTFKGKYIGYDLSIGSQTLNVTADENPHSIQLTYTPTGIMHFYSQVFSVNVPTLPANLVEGSYTGNLSLIITSTI